MFQPTSLAALMSPLRTGGSDRDRPRGFAARRELRQLSQFDGEPHRDGYGLWSAVGGNY